MPEPVTLFIIASTITVASLAYKSTKSLIDFINSLRDAPKLILDLKGDVERAQSVIRSIGLILENRDDRNLPDDLRVCLSSARLPLEDCRMDKLKANIKETKITIFRARMRDTRDALDLALNVCSIKFNGIRADEAKKFEAEMENQIHVLSGKLQGMELSRQKVLDVAEGLSEQNDQLSFQHGDLVRLLAEHERLLREALKFCTTSLLAVEKKTGNKVKMARTVEDAKQIIAVLSNVTGDIGGVIEIEEMIAQGKRKQVGFTNDPNFALELLK